MRSISLGALALCGLLCVVHAQSLGGVSLPSKSAAAKGAAAAASTSSSWTAARLRNAEPFPAPAFNAAAATVAAAAPASAQVQAAVAAASSFDGSSGSPPTNTAPVENTVLFSPKSAQRRSKRTATPSTSTPAPRPPQYFASSPLVPMTSDTSYPYRAVGALFFSASDATGIPSGDYFCSASVVGKRLIMTAGHCVHSGLNGMSGFYSDFLFVPAMRNGTAPFGAWAINGGAVSYNWFSGNGTVPNVADYAVLYVEDLNNVNLAARVGKLGVAYGVVAPNHVTQLGYPCNINSCLRMHRVDSSSHRFGGSNCFEYGSDMRQGVSGGPWVQNFGVLGAGQPLPSFPKRLFRNAVVGVSSYAPEDESQRFLGASNLFKPVLNELFDIACNGISMNECR